MSILVLDQIFRLRSAALKMTAAFVIQGETKITLSFRVEPKRRVESRAVNANLKKPSTQTKQDLSTALKMTKFLSFRWSDSD